MKEFPHETMLLAVPDAVKGPTVTKIASCVGQQKKIITTEPLKIGRIPKGKDHLPTIIFQGRAVKLRMSINTHKDTVDGRNPAPVDRWFVPFFTRVYASQVLQNFFHQTFVAQNQGAKEKTSTIGHYWQVQVLFLVLDFARSCQTSLPFRFLQSFLPAAIVIFFTGASVPWDSNNFSTFWFSSRFGRDRGTCSRSVLWTFNDKANWYH